ncbi:beta family protein [Pseudomonas sp. RHF3.3-3]|uniref:beta family protein n=1 Tax=Pseudomonas sp. RHF3.3-3 TaxID=3396624 RepID=UPI003A84CD28
MAKFPQHPRYVPIIKWQSWEQRALEKVEAAHVHRMQPCIEVRTSKQHLNLLGKLQAVWPHDVLVDYANPSGQLTHVRQNELLDFMQHAVQQKIPASPVLGPAYVASMGAKFMKLATSLPSVVIRLRLDALAVPNDKLQLVQGAYTYLKSAGIDSALIVDLGVSPKEWLPVQIASFSQDLRSLSAIGYKSVHVVSGAYPASLASVKTGSATFKRSDWAFWSDVNASVPDLKVGFGDYGTLSPGWTEDILELRSNRIAIRYTRGSDWLILRADGKTTNDSIAISEILVSTYPQDFKGAGYSFGDEILAERADPNFPVKKKRCGHYHITEGWSHHIAYVLKEQY